MTNKEKCESIKQYVEKKDVVGVLRSFLVDEAYRDVEFARYMKNTYPDLFYSIHPMIIEELEKQKEVITSCVALLENTKLSDKLKSEIALYGKHLAEKNIAMGGAAKELCATFEKAIR